MGIRNRLEGGSSLLIGGGKEDDEDDEEEDDDTLARSSDIDRFVERGGFSSSVLVVVLFKILGSSVVGEPSLETRRE